MEEGCFVCDKGLLHDEGKIFSWGGFGIRLWVLVSLKGEVLRW